MLYAMHYIIYVLKVNVNIKCCENKAKNGKIPNNSKNFDIKIGFNAMKSFPSGKLFIFWGKNIKTILRRILQQ